MYYTESFIGVVLYIYVHLELIVIYLIFLELFELFSQQFRAKLKAFLLNEIKYNIYAQWCQDICR